MITIPFMRNLGCLKRCESNFAFFSNSATIIVIPCSRFALLISLLDLTTGGSDTHDSGGDAWCQVDRYKDHHGQLTTWCQVDRYKDHHGQLTTWC